MLIAACIAAWAGHSSHAEAAPAPARKVVIILAPYLGWGDLSAQTTPQLWALAEDGALGEVNARSRVRLPGDPASPLEGALSISAGAWAVHSTVAAGAYNAWESYEVGTAGEAFERTTGDKVGSNAVVFLGLPMTERLNADRASEVTLGTLGSAVEKAGGITAAIGNSDIGYTTAEQRRIRPAALAAMNSDGLVQLGDVSARLVEEDPHAPFGIQTNMERFGERLTKVAATVKASDKPALVVLDPGDSYRAVKFSTQVTDQIAEKQRARALKTLDGVVGMARESFGDATIMVVSQSTGDPVTGETEGMGPIVIAGQGWKGYVESSSTQRTGVVTDLDVTATALDALGIDRPVQVIGNEMHSVSTSATTDARAAQLARMNATAVAIDDAKPGVVNGFVGLTVVVIAIATFVLVRSRSWSRRFRDFWTVTLKGALLLVLAVPVSSWLTFAWLRWPSTAAEAIIGLLVTTAVVWAIGLLLWWKAAMRVPVAVLSLLTVGVILVDQWLGAPFSFTNFFGYSPLLAARFYGMGNEAAAIVFGASVAGMALIFDEWPDSTAIRYLKRFGIPAFGAVVIATAAAPFWGANVGVAIWGVVGFGLAWVLMNGNHVSWKLVFWLFVAVVVIIAGFAAIDMFGGGQQTHLARALTSAEKGGLGELWIIIARKAATNARVLTRTNWSYILVAMLAFLGFMRWRPQGDFASTLTRNPDFADAITVSLVAGMVAYFTEDSGIVIPALEVFYIGVALVWVMLTSVNGIQAAEEAGSDQESTR